MFFFPNCWDHQGSGLVSNEVVHLPFHRPGKNNATKLASRWPWWLTKVSNWQPKVPFPVWPAHIDLSYTGAFRKALKISSHRMGMEIWPLENCIDKPKRCPKSYKLAETQPCSLLLGNNCVQQNIMLRNIYRVFAAEEMYFWGINENFEAGSGSCAG